MGPRNSGVQGARLADDNHYKQSKKEGVMRVKISFLACVLAMSATTAGAHDLTLNECIEGSDFIMHAAQARDYGLSRDDFLARMESDIQAIKAFPPALRWFVQDTDDEALLVGFARLVFDDPKAPDSHQSDFLQACSERVVTNAPPADELAALQEYLNR
jgi:hypothetical protein